MVRQEALPEWLSNEGVPGPAAGQDKRQAADGQVIVSRDLVARLGVKVMKSVGVCTEMDTVMYRMLRKHPKCRAVVYRAAWPRGGDTWAR